MATKFLEPGGDATFNASIITNGGLWGSIALAPAVATDFVHGAHIKSIKYRPGNGDVVKTSTSIVSDAGARISFYIYINALPTADHNICEILQTVTTIRCISIKLTTAGVLQLWQNTAGNQIGSNGSTLSTGVWYRISLAYTITSSTINSFFLFKDGVQDITGSNVTMANISTSVCSWGNPQADTTLDIRTSDHYIDDSNSLTDTGNIWVTAKRPFTNGTTNGFTTQIGSGGSGYGTGHSPQVNERALSTVNGWSMVGAGSAVTEEYNIESKSVGDININTATIIDYVGWAYVSSLVAETINIILNGVNFSQAITSTNTMYTKVAGSATYPAGTGADIGIQTDTSLTTVSLFECGVMIAYIPAAAPIYVRDMLGMFQ